MIGVTHKGKEYPSMSEAKISALSQETLCTAVSGEAVALRCLRRLQPAGGAGDKVFPPTYEGGQYACEERVIGGQRVPCVLLDSVQSQANRMELALKDAFYHGKSTACEIPVVAVDFTAAELPEFGEVTSLDAPHRLADAILRDSMLGTVKFRATDQGKTLDTASVANATGLFGICPTALIFGLWDSAGPRGGAGTKFQRAIVGELFGVQAQPGVRTSSRIDPLAIQRNAGPLYKTADGWTLAEDDALQEKGKPARLGKDGKPSEANHGNVTPSLSPSGGVTMDYALQTVVISLPALRRLRFPGVSGSCSGERDLAARTCLAALAIAGAVLSIDQGCDLRSRCLLVPEPGQGNWEIVKSDGTVEAFSLSVGDAKALFLTARDAAKQAGLPWQENPLVLKPSAGLAALVKKSRELVINAGAEGE
jgi:CRISPR-associated protein Csb1